MPDYIQHNIQGIITNRWKSADPSVVTGLPNIVKVDRQTWDAITKYSIVDGGKVRAMTQQERDAYDAELAKQVSDAETLRLASLDNLFDSKQLQGITLTKVDTAIDNIGDLADAKVFLKKLCRYIIKFIAGNI